MPYTVLMPIFARAILHGNAHTLGFLMSAAGLGALAGAVTLAMRPSVLGLGRVIVWSASVFGAGLIGLGLSRALWLSLLAVAAAGFGMMRQMASSNTILQTIVAEDKRGRVMAYYSMALQGVAPFGSLAAGAIEARCVCAAPPGSPCACRACAAPCIRFTWNWESCRWRRPCRSSNCAYKSFAQSSDRRCGAAWHPARRLPTAAVTISARLDK
jgi:MFS family permease